MSKRLRTSSPITLTLLLVMATIFLQGCADNPSASAREIGPDDRPIPPIALISDRIADYDEGRSRLMNLLEGMGFAFDLIDNTELGSQSLSDYQLAIIAGSSSREFVVDSTGEASIIQAIKAGSNVLWIGGGIWGTFQTTDLPDALGLRYFDQGWSDEMDIAEATFVNLAGRSDRFVVHKENIFRTEPTTGTVDGWFVSPDGKETSIPFITRYEGDADRGTTVHISMPALDFWKSDETFYTYARAEVLYKYVVDLVNQGYVGKHPALGAKDMTFILRLEDYTPGGTWFRKSIRRFALGMDRLLALAAANDLPVNIGVVPKYAHPYTGEFHRWDSPDPGIQTLKKQAQQAFDRGGSLIVHGFDHQNGDGKTDLSGDDWEMWDDATQQFLSFEEQKQVTDSAFAEISRTWGVIPTIWETPHYSSNEDTYRAAAASGFKYVSESDTKLFPNREGFLNSIRGHLLNIPETAFDFRWEPADIRSNTLLKQTQVLPRLARMRGLFYVFYHNISTHQHRGLENFLETVSRYDVWKPSVEDYAEFWQQRADAQITQYLNTSECRLVANVADGFDGLTLSVRLPDATTPGEVTVNGVRTEAATEQIGGKWFVYPVLNVATSEVIVTYDAPDCPTVAAD